MKSNILVFALLLGVGIVLGAFARPAYTALRQQQQLSGLASELQLSFDRCKDLPASATTVCADGVLIEEAMRTRNKSLCASINDAALQAQCVARVNVLASLGEAGKLCSSISTSAVCPDVMTVLVATESNDLGLCNSIQSQALAQACVSLVSGTDSADQYPGGKVVRSQYNYGYKCDTSIPECVTDIRTFNSIVRSGNASGCDALATNVDFCKAETHLYQAYTTGDLTACSAALTDKQCRFETTIAKALDAGTTALCGTLEADLKAGCDLTVQSIKEKRFEYLNASL